MEKKKKEFLFFSLKKISSPACNHFLFICFLRFSCSVIKNFHLLFCLRKVFFLNFIAIIVTLSPKSIEVSSKFFSSSSSLQVMKRLAQSEKSSLNCCVMMIILLPNSFKKWAKSEWKTKTFRPFSFHPLTNAQRQKQQEVQSNKKVDKFIFLFSVSPSKNSLRLFTFAITNRKLKTGSGCK